MSSSPFPDQYWSLPLTSLCWSPTPPAPAYCCPKAAPKSWDTLRKQDCNAGKIQSGEWLVENGPGLSRTSIAVDFKSFGGRYPTFKISDSVGFSAFGLDQLAEFCTVLAKQLRDC